MQTFLQGLNGLQTIAQPLLINPSVARALLKHFSPSWTQRLYLRISAPEPHALCSGSKSKRWEGGLGPRPGLFHSPQQLHTRAVSPSLIPCGFHTAHHAADRSQAFPVLEFYLPILFPPKVWVTLAQGISKSLVATGLQAVAPGLTSLLPCNTGLKKVQVEKSCFGPQLQVFWLQCV